MISNALRLSALSMFLLLGAPALAQPAGPLAMPTVIDRFVADHSALRRFYDLPMDAASRDRLDRFYREQLAQLDAMDYEALPVADRIDWHLLKNEVNARRHGLAFDARREADLAEVLPFAGPIIALETSRRNREPIDPRAAATTVDQIDKLARDILDRVAKAPAQGQELNEPQAPDPQEEDQDGDQPPTADEAIRISPVHARRAAQQVRALQQALNHWHSYYAAFDPQAAWWLDQPHKDADAALDELATKLLEKIAGITGKDEDPLIGDPIGLEELQAQLRFEWIDYSPQQLIERAQAELAWCEAQLIAASGEMGHGEDWRAALEQVKQAVPAPGEQDDIVAELAAESIAFLDQHELVSVPDLCRETWRVEMLSRQSQRVLPFAAYGGQRVLVAAPTGDMSHPSKLMSLRGNNRHFTRNVTPHELVPGHHLQGFVADREATHRKIFRTPFLVEGWALHWEFVYYDRGWAKGPEDRIGMLFWRTHRAARIVVSLKFHLGQMTPQQMVDFLVDRVGHERDSATSEVRRFIGDAYGPLYQCGYLVGGKQLRDLHQQLVIQGDWTDRAFHDAVLKQNSIPIFFIRAALLQTPLPRDITADWRFWKP